MNEHLKLQIGKRGTLTNNILVNGAMETEYVQGVLRDVKDDVVVIEQYFPYAEFLSGGKAQSIIREFKLSRTVNFKDVWR